MSFERFLKTLHSWLGVVILPWVVLAGLTGFYMNHGNLVLSLFPTDSMGPERFVTEQVVPQTRDSAWMLAETAAGAVDLSKTTRYEGRAVFAFKGNGEDVYVDEQTGHYWLVKRYSRTLFAPDGAQIENDWRWGRILSSVHTRGWIGSTLGTWLADITAIALMVFGCSGLVLFFAPRLRKWKNKRARMKMMAAQAQAKTA